MLNPGEHPEERAARTWMVGRVVEVGCGSRPTTGVRLAVDRTRPGDMGVAGSEAGQRSAAGLAGDMAALPLRADSFDSLVARHVLEHAADTLSVLREWARVARRLVVICPDQQSHAGSTIALDPTHVAAFTPHQLAALAGHAGLLTIATEPVIENWSFMLVARRR